MPTAQTTPPLDLTLLDAIIASDAPPASLHLDVGKRTGRLGHNVKRTIGLYVEAGHLDPDTLTPTPALRKTLAALAGPAAASVSAVSSAAPGAITQLPHNRLEPTGQNYRRTFEDADLESLAASLLAKGQLQSLLCRPHPDQLGRYQVVAGERRWRAFRLLIERGDLPEDTPVDVKIRDLDDRQALGAALAENREQKTVDPFEEAEGFERYRQYVEASGGDTGDVTADIAEDLGCSRRIVQRRLRTIRDLAPDARAAWSEGRIPSFAMAEELSRWPQERQTDALEQIGRTWGPQLNDAGELREWLTRSAPPVGQQIFDEELYAAKGGTFVEPEEDGDPRRFGKLSLAEELTHDWIVEKAAALAEEHGYNDGPVIGDYYTEWSWPQPKKTDKVPADKLHAHFVIDRRTLAVSVIHPVCADEDLQKIRRAAEAGKAAEQGGQTPGVQPLSQRNWTAGSKARTEAIQDIVADSPHLALAMAIVALLPGEESHSRSGSELLHIEGDYRWTRGPVRIGPLDACQGIENGRVIDAEAALDSLCQASLSDLLTRFAAIIASLSGEWSGMAGPGTNGEALFIANVAEGWDDRGHESFNAMAELADIDWCANYTLAQLGAIADALQADERAGADDPRPARKDELAAWLARHRDPEWIPPEARFLCKGQAEAAVTATLRGERA